MHTTIYFVVTATDPQDAQFVTEQLLEPVCTEDNWFQLIATIEQSTGTVTELITRKHDYLPSDYTQENIASCINATEHIAIWSDEYHPWVFDEQSLTNEATSAIGKYLVIINMHT